MPIIGTVLSVLFGAESKDCPSLPQLQVLYLRNNTLSGSLPASFGDGGGLAALRYIVTTCHYLGIPRVAIATERFSLDEATWRDAFGDVSDLFHPHATPDHSHCFAFCCQIAIWHLLGFARLTWHHGV